MWDDVLHLPHMFNGHSLAKGVDAESLKIWPQFRNIRQSAAAIRFRDTNVKTVARKMSQ